MDAIDDRAQVWRGGIFLALSTAGMLAMLPLAEWAPAWVGKSLSDKEHLVMLLSGLACGLGVWQLQEGLGWPRRTWRGRALALVVLPCFVLPAWLGLTVLDRTDPNVALHERAFPGFRISLPNWKVTKQSTADFWSGNLTLSHRGYLVVLRWNPGDAESLPNLLDAFLGNLTNARIGSDSPTVASRPAHTAWVRQDGMIVGYTAFSCGDKRLLILASGDEDEAIARRFHARLLSTVSCVGGAAAPAIVYPKLTLPEGFRQLQQDPSELLYQRGAEELMVSSEHRDMAMFERLGGARGRDEFLGALVQALGARVDGAPQLTERTAEPTEGGGKRQFWSYHLSDSSRVTWSAWKCGDSRWFFAMSTAEPSIAVERLLGARCP